MPTARLGNGHSRSKGDSKLGVLVRIQYAVALNRGVSLGVVSYPEWVGRVRRYRTRLRVCADQLAPQPGHSRVTVSRHLAVISGHQ